MTPQVLYRKACGTYGMQPSEFWQAELREVILFIQGAQDRIQMESRHNYEVMRFAAFRILSPHLKRGASESDIARFPWEKERGKRKELTPEQIAEIERKMDKAATLPKKKINSPKEIK